MSRSGTNQSEDNSYDNEFRPIRLPDFQNTCGRLDPDYWNDILLKIEKENRDAIESEYTNFRMFMVPETVQLIFTICVRLELPHEVRYLALIIFDDFMRLQITKLHEDIAGSEDDEATKAEKWANATLRFCSQGALRAISCISIAIKFSYYRLTFSSSLLKKLLMAMNHLYDESSIIKSESRVYATVMFSVNFHRNPITIMETIACIMLYRFPELLKTIAPDALWEHAVLFMDLIYLNLSVIYKRIWMAIHKGTGDFSLQRERTWHLEADYITLSVGVITLAAYALYGEAFMSEVVTALSNIFRVDPGEIALFAGTVRDFAMENEPEQPSIALPNELLGMRHINGPNSLDFFD